MLIGYARVSTEDQDLEIQKDRLSDAGCERIYFEKETGIRVDIRDELNLLLDHCLRKGDVVVTTSPDRLTRSVAGLVEIDKRLKAIGCSLRVLDMPGLDTSTEEGDLVLGVTVQFASYDYKKRRRTTQAGIERAKAQKKYRGRKPVLKGHKIQELLESGYNLTKIANVLNVSTSAVWAFLKRNPQYERRVCLKRNEIVVHKTI